jgi:hypothetical protein
MVRGVDWYAFPFGGMVSCAVPEMDVNRQIVNPLNSGSGNPIIIPRRYPWQVINFLYNNTSHRLRRYRGDPAATLAGSARGMIPGAVTQRVRLTGEIKNTLIRPAKTGLLSGDDDSRRESGTRPGCHEP